MVQPLMKDALFLSLKSEEATLGDLNIAKDLLDTLAYYHETCVGMAANMIGQRKCIIAFYDEKNKDYSVMLNPVLVAKDGPYKALEGCLCLNGQKETQRYRKITVNCYDLSFKKKTRTLQGFTAQIVQHELDHLQGILI